MSKITIDGLTWSSTVGVKGLMFVFSQRWRVWSSLYVKVVVRHRQYSLVITRRQPSAVQSATYASCSGQSTICISMEKTQQLCHVS